jgi:hypothetical protein
MVLKRRWQLAAPPRLRSLASGYVIAVGVLAFVTLSAASSNAAKKLAREEITP